MIIRKVIVVCYQSICISVFLDRLAERIRYRKLVIGVCRNKSAVIDKECLAFFVICEPVKEILSSLNLLFGSIIGRVDKEVLGAAADQL